MTRFFHEVDFIDGSTRETGQLRNFFQNRYCDLKVGLFFIFNHRVKIAFMTALIFLGKSSLLFPVAEWTGNNPAASTAIFPLMNAFAFRCNRYRANTEFWSVMASGLSPALFVFPAIKFFVFAHVLYVNLWCLFWLIHLSLLLLSSTTGWFMSSLFCM